MADIPFPTNLLPTYQSPQAMAASAASTANTQANTQLTQAQTSGADIGNQGAALRLGLLQNYYQQNQPGAAPSQPAAASSAIGDTGLNADDVTQNAIQKFAPIPTAPPSAAVAQDAYAKSIGAPELAVATYKAQVDAENQRRQLTANQSYQTAETVANAAKDGNAWETLNRINPQAAAALKQKYADATPEELNQDVLTFAQHIGIATHQYTGRDTDFQNGVLVDKKDGKPVLGSSQVLTGLDAAGKEKAFASANEPVQIGDKLPQPRWQAAGFNSAESYVIAADKTARSTAATPAPSTDGNTAATAPPPKKLPTAADVAPADPVLKAALADHDYDQKPLPTPKTQEDLASNNAVRSASNAARAELLGNAQDSTNAGGQALQYLRAAQAVLDSKGAPVTGPLGSLVAKISSPFGGVDATNYQIVAKNLSNAAIQSGKGNFGKGMTENDVSLQKDELSPSVHMTDGALKELLDTGIKNTQYGIDSAKRVGAYLASGKDPQRFAEWNDTHFSRGAAVNGPSSSASSGAPTKVGSAADYAKIPKGSQYVDPNGVTRTKLN